MVRGRSLGVKFNLNSFPNDIMLNKFSCQIEFTAQRQTRQSEADVFSSFPDGKLKTASSPYLSCRRRSSSSQRQRMEDEYMYQ